MKVAIDASPLVINQFSGLSEVIHNLLTNFSSSHQNDQFSLYMNYFLNPASRNNIYYPGTTKRSLRIPRRLVEKWWQQDWPAIDFYLKEIDIFHSLHINVPPANKMKTILTVHDCRYLALSKFYNSRDVEIYRRHMEKALTRVDHVVTVSEFTKKELITYFSYPEERIETIKNGFSSNITEEKSKDEKIGCFLKEKKVPQDYLLYTGVLDPRKNFSRLIEAIQICRKSLGDFPDLVVTGVSFEDWIKSDQAKKAKKIGIINNIYIAGIVDKRILKELTRKALALCYPSLYEGFGFPPLEAMSVGIPVLASNSSSIPEVTGDAACLVNPMSVEDISQGLERIIFDNEYRQKLVKRGSKQLKKYSWRKTSAEYIRLYKEVLDR